MIGEVINLESDISPSSHVVVAHQMGDTTNEAPQNQSIIDDCCAFVDDLHENDGAECIIMHDTVSHDGNNSHHDDDDSIFMSEEEWIETQEHLRVHNDVDLDVDSVAQAVLDVLEEVEEEAAEYEKRPLEEDNALSSASDFLHHHVAEGNDNAASASKVP